MGYEAGQSGVGDIVAGPSKPLGKGKFGRFDHPS
jgi:hypothetical protein